MIIVAGHVTVEPQQRESYLAASARVVEQARGAAGCLDCAISADLIDPGRVNLFERWESAPGLRRRVSDRGALAIRPQAQADAVRTLPRLLMIALNATIVNVVPPSIQEHLGHSRTRVAVGCAGSMP